jgi:hypothetical protein
MKSTGTHIPFTVWAASLFPHLPIAELGMGQYSTPLLNAFARAGRRVFSYETHQDWLKVFLPLLHPNHQMLLVLNGWENVSLDKDWGMVLVDQEPAEARVPVIRRLAHQAKVLVIHDTQDQGYAYANIWPLFKYRADYTFWPTTTAVVSNSYDVGAWNGPNL